MPFEGVTNLNQRAETRPCRARTAQHAEADGPPLQHIARIDRQQGSRAAEQNGGEVERDGTQHDRLRPYELDAFNDARQTLLNRRALYARRCPSAERQERNERHQVGDTAPIQESHLATRIAAPRGAMRKAPQQARSRATIDAILDAAAHILGERGWEGLTTNGVAQAAGTSIGSLYQYFPNKLALIDAVRRRHFDDVLAVLHAAANLAMSRQGRIAALVDGMIAVHSGIRRHTAYCWKRVHAARNRVAHMIASMWSAQRPTKRCS